MCVTLVRNLASLFQPQQRLLELRISARSASLSGVQAIEHLINSSSVAHAFIGCSEDTEWSALDRLNRLGVRVSVVLIQSESGPPTDLIYGVRTAQDAWVVAGVCGLSPSSLSTAGQAAVQYEGSVNSPFVRQVKKFFDEVAETAVPLNAALLNRVRVAEEAYRDLWSHGTGGSRPTFLSTPLGTELLQYHSASRFIHYIQSTKMEASYKMVILWHLLQSPSGSLSNREMEAKFERFYRLLLAQELAPEREGIGMGQLAEGSTRRSISAILNDAPRKALTRARIVEFRDGVVRIEPTIWGSLDPAKRYVAASAAVRRLDEYYEGELGQHADYAQVLARSAS